MIPDQGSVLQARGKGQGIEFEGWPIGKNKGGGVSTVCPQPGA